MLVENAATRPKKMKSAWDFAFQQAGQHRRGNTAVTKRKKGTNARVESKGQGRANARGEGTRQREGKRGGAVPPAGPGWAAAQITRGRASWNFTEGPRVVKK